MNDSTEIHSHDPPSDPPRARKRRRRTMACTQCRSRKLRCDREYPICSRCQKSKNPAQCTYEDGFLWQQPSTVPATTVFSGAAGGAPGGGSSGTTATATNTVPDATVNNGYNNANHNPASLPRLADRTPLHNPPDSAITDWASRAQAQTSGIERRTECEGKKDRFLETVLGAPKSAVNQDSYVNTEVLQRYPLGSSGHSGYYPASLHHGHHHSGPTHLPPLHHQHYSHYGYGHYNPEQDEEDEMGLASPSQQLNLAPRIMMRGKETRTRFNGSGILANVMAQVCSLVG